MKELAVFKYVKWQELYKTERPYQILSALPEEDPDARSSNLIFHDGPPQEVEDVRGQESKFSLNEHGFQYISHISELSPVDLKNEALVETRYFDECEKILRDRLDDVSQVVFFDWRLRDTEALDANGASINLNDPTARLPPARFVHIDQAPEGVLTRLEKKLGDKMNETLRSSARVRVVNVWRPINGPVKNWPLAVCDSTTMDPKKLLVTDQIRQAYAGVSLYAMYHEKMKWYFMNDQNDDEVLLIKQFDTLTVPAKNCPHSSFLQDRELPNRCSRQSIEVRAFVFS